MSALPMHIHAVNFLVAASNLVESDSPSPIALFLLLLFLLLLFLLLLGGGGDSVVHSKHGGIIVAICITTGHHLAVAFCRRLLVP